MESERSRLLGRAVIGAAAVITAGIVVFAVRGTGGSAEKGFDYNCDLPGLGYPWLEQWDTIVATDSGEEVRLWNWEDPTASAGYFDGPGGFRVFLPVPVDDDGKPESMLDVYRTLCRFHPDLGGGGLRAPTTDELQPIGDCFVGPGLNDLPLYTEGTPRGSNEAHMCSEQVRVYGLPELPADVASVLSTEEAATGESSTTIESRGQQAWSIACTGYEVDEMNPHWQTTTGLRGAIRFDYQLRGNFSTVQDGGKTEFGSGSVTSAQIRLSDLYGPPGAWELGPLNCVGCNAIGPGAPLAGTILPGNEIILGWGAFLPEVNVDARVVRSCTPMPGCAEWKSRWYISDTFYHRLAALGLVLEDGFTAGDRVTSPQGDTWIEMSCTLATR